MQCFIKIGADITLFARRNNFKSNSLEDIQLNYGLKLEKSLLNTIYYHLANFKFVYKTIILAFIFTKNLKLLFKELSELFFIIVINKKV